MLLKRLKFSVNKTIVSTMVILMVCLLSYEAGAQNAMSREHLPAKRLVTEAKLYHQIGFLSDTLCNGRGFGTRGSVEAAFWLERQFQRIGLLKIGETYCQKVIDDKGKVGRNMVGMLPGSKCTGRDKYIIVGAHYDHLGKIGESVFPGADANASGVVAMLNLAEMLSALKDHGKIHSQNIIFVAFDGKEQNMLGSTTLWRMIQRGELKDPQTGKTITKDKITLMVNIDQIGSTLTPPKSGREDYMIMLGTPSLESSKRGLLNKCNTQYAIDLEIDLTYYGSANFTKTFYRLSDQRIFVENNIPAVLFTSGITMNTYKTWDKVETLDMKVLKKRIFLIYHWIDQMIQ